MNQKLKKRNPLLKEIKLHWELYLFMLPGLACLIIFHYVPMSGVLMSLQNVRMGDEYLKSAWVGLEHFGTFFKSYWLPLMVRNTAIISILTQVLAWPCGLGLALLLHNSNSRFLRKTTQNLSYIPHLLSMVIVVAILDLFCASNTGLINIIAMKLGGSNTKFLEDPGLVYFFHVITSIWQGTGYSAIVYLGSLASVDEQQIEAAKIDGASKLKIITKIQIPTIMPTVVTMLILSLGNMFTLGADKGYLLQNPLNIERSEIISVYVYKAGLMDAQYGFSAAIGLLQNVINLVMLFLVNAVASKVTDTSVV